MKTLNDFWSTLSPSDKIQIVSIVVSAAVSLLAICISICTLLQSSKAIKDAARPYIVIYPQRTCFQAIHYYLVVKNFGQTGACITDFSCDHDLSLLSCFKNVVPFKHLVGTYIAPGQSIVAAINYKYYSTCNEDWTFSISYKAGRKEYKKQNFVIHPQNHHDLTSKRATTKNKELLVISCVLQDLVEKLL